MTSDPSRTAIVTGAAGGIGTAIAKKLIAAGHRVVLADVSEAGLGIAAASLPLDQTLSVVCDITTREAPSILEAAIRERWPPVQILVNNAGVSPKHAGQPQRLAEITLEEWSYVLGVNVTAPMRLAQRFVPYMASQQWGRVINISSRAGRSVANSAGPAYMTSKAAILGLTRSIASDFAKFGVTANSVAPGIVSTSLSGAVSKELLEQITLRSVMGRSGSAAEVAASVAFLASVDAGYINGACLDVNGGAFMC
jgi:3-oxoacyl-[acyl-carrier protein] reductase